MSANGSNPGDGLPTGDGDINVYESPKLRNTKWFKPHRRAIFVNGIWTSPESHRAAARALSTFVACPVIGVYNATDGRWSDIRQCIMDEVIQTPLWWVDLLRKIAVAAPPVEAVQPALDAVFPNGSGNLSFLTVQLAFNAYCQVAERLEFITKTRIDRVSVMKKILGSNRATCRLFEFLRSGATGAKSAPLYPHSQGNLIVSNALTAVAVVDGPGAISGRKVYSFGSPCPYWPPGIEHHNYAFRDDWVALLSSILQDPHGIQARGPNPLFSHDFTDYLKTFACSSQQRATQVCFR